MHKQIYSGELAFLAEFAKDHYQQYRQAAWLKSSFESPIWRCSFEKTVCIDIDFHVKLDDGSLLTHKKNSALLEVFKCWLCIQTEPAINGGIYYSPSSSRSVISRVLVLIDYFLLSANKFGLAAHGLEALTVNDFTELLSQFGDSNFSSLSIYRWHERLTEFLREKISALTESEIARIVDLYPPLVGNIPPVQERLLNLSEIEIIKSRIWLYQNKFYRRRANAEEDYRLSPNTDALAKIIYANTLGGKAQKLIPRELLLETTFHRGREYPAIPVRECADERVSIVTLRQYKNALMSLKLLEEAGFSIPKFAINSLENKDIHHSVSPKGVNRFRTLPQDLTFKLVRKAIEFVLEYGEHIVQSSLSVLKAENSNKSERSQIARNDIKAFLTPELVAIGTKVWHLGYQVSVVERNASQLRSSSDGKEHYYKRFRANEGLWELVRVLYGAIQIIVGVLSARRQGELIDLKVGSGFDLSGEYILFYNRKSGVFGKRDLEARPIPTIAINSVKLLERLHQGLYDVKLVSNIPSLFSYPLSRGKGIVALGSSQYNQSIDYFCDYIETPINDLGQRYYPRQHQFRRFFSMLFFWGGSFGGMETLRWFLGHTDIAHLYHYITESTPGAVLRSIQANCAAGMVKAGLPDTTALADLLAAKFNTSDFSILDSTELEEYIEELIAEGVVHVQPIFFNTVDGKSYKILIKITQAEG